MSKKTKDTEPVAVAPEDQSLTEEVYREQLAAAKELIEAQSELLDCFALRRPRVKATEKLFAAKEKWEALYE